MRFKEEECNLVLPRLDNQIMYVLNYVSYQERVDLWEAKRFVMTDLPALRHSWMSLSGRKHLLILL
jgi:hypothetical protein